MVKLKIILDTRRAKPDGTFPIMFRITNQKQVNYLSFGVSIKDIHWDVNDCSVKKGHPNAATLNSLLYKRFYEVQKIIIRLEEEEAFSIDTLKDALTPKPKPQQVKPSTFKEFSQTVIDDFIKSKRTGNGLVYLTAVNRLINYCDNPNLTFKEIDYSFLEGFKIKLIEDGIKKNTIGNYFRSIRALFNKAIKAKLVQRELYPFTDISIKTEKTAKRAIKVNDLATLFRAPKRINSQLWHAANYFFLSFALRGVSFTDMAYLTINNINDNYLTYRRRKTQKLYCIKLHPLALQILSYYENASNGYLLPVFPKGIEEDGIEAKKITRQWIKTTNKYLNRLAIANGIQSHITSYVARHCWATFAKWLGYPIELIAEALGHEYGNKITSIYLDIFDQSLIDNANERVILCIKPCVQELMHPYKYALKYTKRNIFQYLTDRRKVRLELVHPKAA